MDSRGHQARGANQKSSCSRPDGIGRAARATKAAAGPLQLLDSWKLRFGCGLLLLLSSGVFYNARSQVVTGIIVDQAGQNVAGAVAVLLDSRSRAVARALSGRSGNFLLRAPVDGVYRIRTLRIGFRPTMTGEFRLIAGQTIEQRIPIDALPLVLDTVRVENESACGQVDKDSASTVFAAWEQVRTAITATQLTSTGQAIRATTLSFARTLEPSDGRIRTQSSTVSTAYVRQPWRSLRPDSLRRFGYTTSDADGTTTFYAPGLDMLLSPEFVQDHCFHLADAANPKELALAFAPVPDRRRIPEISGAVTLDRATSQLRRLEFKYVNVPPEERQYAGGEMQFARLSTGGWVISQWSIQMPVLERPAASESFRGQRLPDSGLHVAELQVDGGALTLVLSKNDTVWLHPTITLTGVALDSVSRTPIAHARVLLAGTQLAGVSDDHGRFEIADVLPGAYSVDVRTPGLDSLDATYLVHVVVADSATTVELRVPTARQLQSQLCGRRTLAEPGIVSGTVTAAHGYSLPGDARVIVSWVVQRLKDGGAGQPFVLRERRSLEARVASNGTYSVCGVPTNTPLDLSAIAKGAETSETTEVRIPANRRYVRADLKLTRLGNEAVLAGVVSIDSTEQPVADAEVLLSDLNRTTTTNAMGAFRFTGIPPGIHHVVVRRLGYGPAETDLRFSAGARIERRVYLRRVRILESVLVTESTVDPSVRSFEEHRRTGLGHFLTHADLTKAEGLSIEAALQELAGVHFAHGRSNQVWIIGGRGAKTLDARNLPAGDVTDRQAGAVPDCYAQVYVGRTLMYSGRRGEPLFDISSVRPDQLEAVEYYAGAAEAPGEYGGLGSVCGVLVLWPGRTR